MKTTKKLFAFLLAVVMLSTSFVFTFPAQAAKKETGLSLARQTVVAEMKKMAVAKWSPSKTYTTNHVYYYNNGGGEKMSWKKGKTYYGIPYSQTPTIRNKFNSENKATYEVFENALDKNGCLSSDIGRNDCSSSVVMAIQTVDKKMKLSFTRVMRPGSNNIVAVGSYTYYGGKLETCQKNGTAVMYSCYSKLKPGDMLIQDGHAMLVSGVDAENKKVYVIHHTSYDKHYDPKTDTTVWSHSDSYTNTNWGVNDELSFYYLWYNGYVPLASKTLIEDDKKSHDVTMCSKVQGLTCSGSTPTSVTLSWKKDKKATGYIIYQYANGEYKEIGSTKKTSFTVENLYSAKDYSFAVKSYLKHNKKVYVYINYTFTAATTLPKKVTGLNARLSDDESTATLKWKKVNRAETYYIYMSSSKNGKFKYIASTDSTSYTVENLNSEKTYRFKVTAVIRRKGVKLKGASSAAVTAV